MPDRHGPGTHLGYLSPPPGDEITAHQKHILQTVYGECRAHEFPGESHEAKERCARIAWGAAKKG